MAYNTTTSEATVTNTLALTSILFSDGTFQNTAPSYSMLYGMANGYYYNGQRVRFVNGLSVPAPVWKTSASAFLQFTSSDTINLDTFSPLKSGVYTLTFDIGYGSYVEGTDDSKLDALYSIGFSLGGTSVPPNPQLCGLISYQVLGGQDSVRTNAPTCGSITTTFVAGQSYYIQVNNFQTTNGKTGRCSTSLVSLAMTYIGDVNV
jgi:hypothetical protein